MDNRMLDVVLGLTLVLALFSLAVTAMVELWATLRVRRNHVLKQTLASLLGDDWGAMNRLLASPLLASLATGTVQQDGAGQPQRIKGRTPVYLPGQAVVAALIDLPWGGQETPRPATPAEWVRSLRAQSSPPVLTRDAVDVFLPSLFRKQQYTQIPQGAALHPSPALVGSLKALLPGVERDWPAFERRLIGWYDAVGERSIGWYKRETQLRLFVCGVLLAVIGNINPLVIVDRLWHDAPLRARLAQEAVRVDAAQQAATAASSPLGEAQYRQLLAGLPPAAGVVAATGAAPPADAVDRRLRALAQALGQAQLAAGHDDLALWRRFESLREALEKIDQALQARRVAHPPRGPCPDAATEAGEECLFQDRFLRRQVDLLRQDLVGASVHAGGSDLPDRLDLLNRALARELSIAQPKTDARTVPRACTGLEKEPEALALCESLRAFESVASLGLPMGWADGLWPGRPAPAHCLATTSGGGCASALPPAPAASVSPAAASAAAGGSPQVTPQDASFRWSDPGWGRWVVALLGWLTTGVAATLGAPFWFDLLSKVVRLRGAGNRPASAGSGEGGEGRGGSGSPPPTHGDLGARPHPEASAPSDASGAAERAIPSDAVNPAERALTPSERLRVQARLGLSGPALTGRFDRTTRDAIAVWQAGRGDEASGELSAMQIQSLLGATGARDEQGYAG